MPRRRRTGAQPAATSSKDRDLMGGKGKGGRGESGGYRGRPRDNKGKGGRGGGSRGGASSKGGYGKGGDNRNRGKGGYQGGRNGGGNASAGPSLISIMEKRYAPVSDACMKAAARVSHRLLLPKAEFEWTPRGAGWSPCGRGWPRATCRTVGAPCCIFLAHIGRGF